MELDIRPLTPELLKDYLYFFDRVAFTDHPDWARCYCIHFHWQAGWDDEPERENRDRVVEHINAGMIKGYLAYSDGKVVGWCNANDAENYAALEHNVPPEIWERREGVKVKSVVCFLVSPACRGKGIATEMLKRVCQDAEADGYDFIEGYPPAGDCDLYRAHHGTVPLFEKCGFDVVKGHGDRCVVRRYLGRRAGLARACLL